MLERDSDLVWIQAKFAYSVWCFLVSLWCIMVCFPLSLFLSVSLSIYLFSSVSLSLALHLSLFSSAVRLSQAGLCASWHSRAEKPRSPVCVPFQLSRHHLTPISLIRAARGCGIAARPVCNRARERYSEMEREREKERCRERYKKESQWKRNTKWERWGVKEASRQSHGRLLTNNNKQTIIKAITHWHGN